MAEELIVGGAGEIVERAISLAIDELVLVIGVKGELKKLKAVLTHIQAVLQDAEEKQVKENEVKVWLQELKQLSYDAEDVLDEIAYNELKYSTVHNNNKLPGWLNNPLRLATRIKMAHRIKAINLELDGIDKRKSAFQLKTNDQAGASSSLSGQMIDRETTSHLKDNVIGRESDKEDIIKMLINHDHGSSSSSSSSTAGNNIALPVIAIVGLGGLGKTTLAQLVYNDDAVKKHFQLKVWICVFTNFRTTNLFFQILQQINPNNAVPESSSKQVLLQGLESQLAQQGTKKKFLLVLDDDWNENQEMWEDFVFSLRDIVGTGSRIIVTTRDSNVASIRGDQTVHVHQLQGLSEYSCWDIIKSRAFKNGEPVKPSLLEIGKQISDKCKGMPLAAKVLGGMLQSKREDHEWEAVRDAEFWKLPSDGTNKLWRS
ncbi:hypothetical protein Scep_010828 [Stephania cephalantha]|uniref:Disease resistance protein RGA3 n=1 Tax=Stephania cephalantha TaxID=152367 RepID=A0AAP0JVX0_9MAGN